VQQCCAQAQPEWARAQSDSVVPKTGKLEHKFRNQIYTIS
jgi:hypothetical protein